MSTLQDLTAALDEVAAAAAKARAIALSLAPTIRTVRAGEDLQAALDAGEPLQLEAGATFAWVILRSGARLIGAPGAVVRSDRGVPALLVPPGQADIEVDGLEAASTGNAVIQVGANDATQARPEDAPTNVRLRQVRVPSHRGKRAFEIHGAWVLLESCVALDVWDPAGRDSQAIYVGNSPGGIVVRGGRYSAGSEVFLSGGAVTAIPGCVPTGIVLEDTVLFRPLAWKTDGVSRKVKNLLEVKSGHQIAVRRSRLEGCWADGQAGEAVMLTPALDGHRRATPLVSGDVADVTLEDCEIREVGSLFNILGCASDSATAAPTRNITVRRVTGVASRARFGGRGQIALIQGDPSHLLFESNTFTVDGSSALYTYWADQLQPDGTVARSGPIDGLRIVSNRIGILGEYGFMTHGWANARNTSAIQSFLVEGNVFGGAKTMQFWLPSNTYLDEATWRQA